MDGKQVFFEEFLLLVEIELHDKPQASKSEQVGY